MICTNPDLGYEGMVGAVIAGGIFEGIVGLSARYWKRFLTPVVSACVVIAIGLSLLSVGMNSWGAEMEPKILEHGIIFLWSIYIDRVPCSQIYFKRCI